LLGLPHLQGHPKPRRTILTDRSVRSVEFV
jgi:hypothetical protein